MLQSTDRRRTACGISAIFFAVAAIGFGFSGLVLDNTASWALGTFGKVAFLLAVAWLAWPQLVWLSELPGGGIATVAVGVGAIVFLLRPRILLYVLPGILGIMILFLAFGFIQRYLLPPK